MITEGKVYAPLTASHTSTVVEECISLLRTLHILSDWNTQFNTLLANKLAVASDLLTHPFLNLQVQVFSLFFFKLLFNYN